MGEYLKNINWKHVLIMCIGNVFAGMGIGIFKLAGLGTDPFSGIWRLQIRLVWLMVTFS